MLFVVSAGPFYYIRCQLFVAFHLGIVSDFSSKSTRNGAPKWMRGFLWLDHVHDGNHKNIAIDNYIWSHDYKKFLSTKSGGRSDEW